MGAMNNYWHPSQHEEQYYKEEVPTPAAEKKSHTSKTGPNRQTMKKKNKKKKNKAQFHDCSCGLKNTKSTTLKVGGAACGLVTCLGIIGGAAFYCVGGTFGMITENDVSIVDSPLFSVQKECA